MKESNDFLTHAKDNLGKVFTALESTTEDINIIDLLQKAGIALETYMKSLKVLCHGCNIILKCNPWDDNTNGCN